MPSYLHYCCHTLFMVAEHMTVKDVCWCFLPTGSVTVTSLYDLNDQDAYIYSHLLTGKQLRSMLDVSIKSIGNSNSTDFLHVSRK
jgi:hypothetical protein